MHEKWSRIVRALLWIAAGLTAFPVLAMLGVFGLSLMYGAGNVTTCLFVLQLLCVAAILTVTVLRLVGRRMPVWLWAALSAGMVGLTVTLIILGLDDPKSGVVIGLVLIPALGASAVLILNGLWTLFSHRTETTNPPERVPHAPQSWPLRLTKAALALLCAGGACVAAYWLVTLYALFGSPTGLPENIQVILLEEGTALFCFAVMALSILRLVKLWCRPWACIACGAVYGVLLTAACCMGGGLLHPWAWELALMQLIYVLTLLGLNGLWWLLERKKETEESTNEQEA